MRCVTDGDVHVFPITREIARRLDERDGPDAPVLSAPPPEPGACKHPRATLDVDARRLSCSVCDQTLDPFAWIDALASDWDGYVRRWRLARDRVRDLEKLVADLERQEKNARARVRRREPPEAKEARLALKEASSVLFDLTSGLGVVAGGKSGARLTVPQERIRAAWSRCYRAAADLDPSKIAASE